MLVAHTWKLWGTYYYALKTPAGLTSDMFLGTMPFDDVAVMDTGLDDPENTGTPEMIMPAENFVTGILDPPIRRSVPPTTL